jgi:hypothetical protein
MSAVSAGSSAVSYSESDGWMNLLLALLSATSDDVDVDLSTSFSSW